MPGIAGLLVGNDTRDDAAVYDLGGGQALISTTDFFMPIVDDPFDFGRIASVNAISDVYAMGGRPVLAIAVLGWPVEKLPPEIAARVLEGSRSVCAEAGIPLAGGHSIDCPEPVFGLAVSGLVDTDHLKKNSTATAGCSLLLTKPLGVGILSTARKKGCLLAQHEDIAASWMTRLNSIGTRLGGLPSVKAMTDVTGFGLLGHLAEMCEASGLKAVIDYERIPVIPEALEYLRKGCIPGGTERNWKSYGSKVSRLPEEERLILADPQTSGGLLIAVEEAGAAEVASLMKDQGDGELAIPIGSLHNGDGPLITVS